MKNKNSLNTAYESNGRLRKKAHELSPKNSCWHPRIEALLAKDYHFLRSSFSEQGYLFRGMSSQFTKGLKEQKFGYFNDERPQCLLETELNIFFLSHELSDALSISRLWQTDKDGAILVLPSSYFNQALKSYEAAIMGFAEPGFVFQYPFLVDPICLTDLAYTIVHPSMAKNITYNEQCTNLNHQSIYPAIDQQTNNPKEDMEQALCKLSDEHNISPAKIVHSDKFPNKLFQRS